MNRPWMQLYTRDWLDSKELRRCSPLSRSVLTDLMCLASEGEPYGYLRDKVGPLGDQYLASRCVIPLAKFRLAMKELLAHARLHEDSDGLFVKRMVDDEHLRLRRATGGNASVGHPNTQPKKEKRGYPPMDPLSEIDSRERGRADSDSVSDSDFDSKKSLVSEISKTPLLDNFATFLEASTACGLPSGGTDITQAGFEWRKLDFEQKQLAIKGLYDRKAAGEYADPSYRPLPQNYLKKHLWQRPIRASPTSKRDTVLEHRNEVLKITDFLGGMK